MAIACLRCTTGNEDTIVSFSEVFIDLAILSIHNTLLTHTTHELNLSLTDQPLARSTRQAIFVVGKDKRIIVLAPSSHLLTLPLSLTKMYASKVRRSLSILAIFSNLNRLRRQSMLRRNRCQSSHLISTSFKHSVQTPNLF